MTPEQEALREKVAREFTGHIASTCCHRTGGINDDPKCECRVLADAAIAVVLKEAPEIKRLRAVLQKVSDGDVPRPIGKTYRSDGLESKNDQCIHGQWMYEECGECISAYARAALNPSGSSAAS